MESLNTNNREVLHTLTAIDNLLTAFAFRLVLQWIPGHTDIQGNDRADRLAKHGSLSEQPTKTTSLQTVKQIIKRRYREDWMNMWATETTGRTVYKFMDKPQLKDSYKFLERRDQTIIFRLRTGHIALNQHLNRINPQHPPMCPLYDHPKETVDHLLLDCLKLQQLREQLLPPTLDMRQILYGTIEQLKKTCTYYRMATGRRAEAQRLLG